MLVEHVFRLLKRGSPRVGPATAGVAEGSTVDDSPHIPAAAAAAAADIDDVAAAEDDDGTAPGKQDASPAAPYDGKVVYSLAKLCSPPYVVAVAREVCCTLAKAACGQCTLLVVRKGNHIASRKMPTSPMTT